MAPSRTVSGNVQCYAAWNSGPALYRTQLMRKLVSVVDDWRIEGFDRELGGFDDAGLVLRGFGGCDKVAPTNISLTQVDIKIPIRLHTTIRLLLSSSYSTNNKPLDPTYPYHWRSFFLSLNSSRRTSIQSVFLPLKAILLANPVIAKFWISTSSHHCEKYTRALKDLFICH